eukprot:SAG22_NODE_496_length_9797_cov_4.177241_1_plen_74_part_00
MMSAEIIWFHPWSCHDHRRAAVAYGSQAEPAGPLGAAEALPWRDLRALGSRAAWPPRVGVDELAAPAFVADLL